MLAKSCQWWLIWYLLFFCHGGAEGQLQWIVKEKVTAYGHNLILFCLVENCCSELAGWSVGNKSIIRDVKTFSNDLSLKYHGTYNTDGFGVVIRNLSEADLNVTYQCSYGINQSTRIYLLHGDVFKENVPDKDKDNDTAAIVVPSVVTMVLVGIGIVAYYVYRSRIKRQTGIDDDMEVLYNSNFQMENQQGTDGEMAEFNPLHRQMQNQQDTDGEMAELNLLHRQMQNQQDTDGEMAELKLLHRQMQNQQEWFYKLDLKCDNIDIHCIVDRRLERKYVSLKQERYGQHLVDDYPLTMTVNQLNQSEFEQLYTIKSTVSDRTQLNLRHALVDASRQQLSILCRWLMENIHNRGVTNKEMEWALDIAFKNLDKDTAKAISWCITKTFYKTFQVNLSHCFDVYPGLRCQCLNKGHNANALCSNDKLIIITAGTEVKDLPAEYKGFKIKIMDVNGKSTEKSESETLSAFLSQNYTDSHHIKVNISNSTAKKLFDSHSNLALICPSVHRSFLFARKHKEHKVESELCIQLYCKLKGILPLGEIHFPDSIHGIPTDVIDGEASFMSKLRIGDKIGQETSIGTLGGFVQHLGFDCFLTCAHVMYDVQKLVGSSPNCEEVKAYAHTPLGIIECGKVVWRNFDHDDRSKTSVDAALVWLQNSTMDPNDYILDRACPFSKLGLSTPYLNSSILDRDDLGAPQATAKVVGWGAMTKLPQVDVTFPKQSDVDIQFSNIGQAASSANGNVFQPLWIQTPAHMQYNVGNRMFRMYNQICINLKLKPGDSGTCIYIFQHPNKNGCIGMAIAFCGSMTIVTPLKDIFNRMSI